VSKLTAFLPDALLLGGAGALAYGAWLIYQPAGFIVAGALALLGGVLLSRSAV
jgi:hypothetical protein